MTNTNKMKIEAICFRRFLRQTLRFSLLALYLLLLFWERIFCDFFFFLCFFYVLLKFRSCVSLVLRSVLKQRRWIPNWRAKWMACRSNTPILRSDTNWNATHIQRIRRVMGRTNTSSRRTHARTSDVWVKWTSRNCSTWMGDSVFTPRGVLNTYETAKCYPMTSRRSFTEWIHDGEHAAGVWNIQRNVNTEQLMQWSICCEQLSRRWLAWKTQWKFSPFRLSSIECLREKWERESGSI